MYLSISQITSTDEDARQAMMMDRSKLKEIQVRLLLSSRAEMQKVIETARQTTISFMQFQQQQQQQQQAVPASTPQSPPLQSMPAPLKPPPIPPQIPHQLATQLQPQITAQLASQLPQQLASQMPNLIASNTMTGLLTQQMFQQQLQQKQQQQQVALLLNDANISGNEKIRQRSRSRSRSRSRDRRRSRRSRSRSRSPYRSRRDRSHRSRSNERRSSRSDKSRSDRDKDSDSKRTSRFSDATSGVANNKMQTQSQVTSSVFATMASNGSFGMNNASMPVYQSNMMNLGNMNDAHQKMLANYQNLQSNMNQASNMQNANNPFSSVYNPQLASFNANLGMNVQNQVGKSGRNRNAGSEERSFNNTMNNSNSTNCIQISGVHNYVSYAEIRKFFHGLQISADGIKMINDQDGKRTGIVYVRFSWAGSVPKACERSNERMLRNVIKIEPLDSKEFNDAIDNYRPSKRNNYNNRNSGRSGRDRNMKQNDSDSNNESDNDDVMCISDSNDSAKPQAPFTTVLIEDLPPFTKEQDIIKMFSAYPLLHIVMAKRPKMFSSYVKFHSADDARIAVNDTASHKISFKTVYLSACSEEEFETARKEFSGELDLDFGIRSPDANGGNDKRQLERSPQHSHNDDESQHHSNTDDEGPSNTKSMPKLSLEGIPGVNLADPRMKKYGLIPGSDGNGNSNGMQERQDPRLSAYSRRSDGAHNGVQDPDSTNCILITNMEYRTTENEVADWLAAANLTSIHIQLLYNQRNQTNGTCYVQFATSADAERSLSLDGEKFKSRNISVKLVPLEVVQNETAALSARFGNDVSNLNNIPPNLRINNFASNSFGNNSGNNFGQNMFNSNGPTNNRMNFSRRDGDGNGHFNNTMGCIVALQNVPYKAKMNDILDFFSDFSLRPENIMRRFNNDGLPTGDARVCFNSPNDARRAVEQKHNCRIMNRSVQLAIL